MAKKPPPFLKKGDKNNDKEKNNDKRNNKNAKGKKRK